MRKELENFGLEIKIHNYDKLTCDLRSSDPATRTDYTGSIKNAILYYCLSKREVIQVPACDLEDAIEKIMYNIGNDACERSFIRKQIGSMLMVFTDEWTKRSIKFTPEERQLIKENKIYRIEL